MNRGSYADSADAILVCSKLGQALTPIPDVPLPGSPCDSIHLPARRCYLAAHIWCLDMMLQRRNCHVKNLQDQVLKINEDTVWCLNGRRFNQCRHVGYTTRGKCRDKWSYLTEDLNIISEGILFGYIDLNSKPIEPCSCSCLSKLKRALIRLK
jgi:hypothetical protein